MNVAMMFEEAVVDEMTHEVDPIQEIRLRTWARQNYLPEEERDEQWHPVILEEMRQKDGESDLDD